MPQLFPVSHRDSLKLVQVYSDKHVIVCSCTLSKSVAWSDPCVSVVSLTTYINNFSCKAGDHGREGTLSSRRSYTSDKVRELVVTLTAAQLLQCSLVVLHKKRAE